MPFSSQFACAVVGFTHNNLGVRKFLKHHSRQYLKTWLYLIISGQYATAFKLTTSFLGKYFLDNLANTFYQGRHFLRICESDV